MLERFGAQSVAPPALMQSEPEESPTPSTTTAFSSLLSQALALSLCLTFCLWLYVAARTPFSFRLTQDVNLEPVSTTASDLSQIVPLFRALGVQQVHEELERNQTLQHLRHALSRTAKPTAAAEIAATAADNADSLHEATHITSAVADAFNITSTQLCHWLEDDVTLFNTQQRVLVAGLLTNTEALMPHYVLQLLKYATAMPPGGVFVTMYESGSTDLTGLSAALKLMQPVQLQQQCYWS